MLTFRLTFDVKSHTNSEFYTFYSILVCTFQITIYLFSNMILNAFLHARVIVSSHFGFQHLPCLSQGHAGAHFLNISICNNGIVTSGERILVNLLQGPSLLVHAIEWTAVTLRHPSAAPSPLRCVSPLAYARMVQHHMKMADCLAKMAHWR